MYKQLKKYLRTRAASGPWQIEGADRQNYQAAIVIPALAERDNLPKTLAALATNPVEQLLQTLIIIVFNNRADAARDQKKENQQTLEWLKSIPFPTLNISCVDATSSGLELPAKQGVGLARKIGFDLILSQLDWSQNPLLISLDADTLVDENYLPAIFDHFRISKCGGAAIPFRHQRAEDSLQETAIRCYELYLRSYLFGLQQVGSPYAYHTIGSAFACRAEAYVAAGGMNQRKAGEDFYFLQQLAKTCGVDMLSGTVVRPSPRFSARVPFGTGNAVQTQVDNQQLVFQFSSAAAFSILQDWLNLIEMSLDQPAIDLLSQGAEFSAELKSFLLELEFVDNWGKLQKNYSTKEGRLAAFHCWFDGLRTRQLLTRLDVDIDRSAGELVVELLEWGGHCGFKHPDDQLRLLERLQFAG